uniref:Protein kinase putative n=1 Tax=Albugo laibachii Nc14 TaxID=890382 RepID=F0WDP9_9STRA|nr:protein kinase putative [Albugo laibachii Nc14]|eukprot:CCA19325.1 protein kinase putative [Albugo laibachii Nc14]
MQTARRAAGTFKALITSGYKRSERSLLSHYHDFNDLISTYTARQSDYDTKETVELEPKYMTQLLILPDNQIFKSYSRVFENSNLEKSYQTFASEHWFARARWHIWIWMLLHGLMHGLFSILPSSGIYGMDQFVRSWTHFSDYLQWVYLLFVIPFALPRCSVPLVQRYWRFWVCCIIVLSNLGFQSWLARANRVALNIFLDKIEKYLHCSPKFGESWDYNNESWVISLNDLESNVTKRLLSNVKYNGFMTQQFRLPLGRESEDVLTSPLHANEEELQLDRRWISRGFPHIRLQRQVFSYFVERYFGILLQVIIGFVSISSFIFAISIRLEFTQVIVVAAAAIITYIASLWIAGYTVHILAASTFFLALVLLLLLSYFSDGTNRRSFLATFQIEKENASLKSSLNKAEAALMHGTAVEEEKRAVEQVFGSIDSSGDEECRDDEVDSATATDAISSRRLHLIQIPFDDLEFLHAIGRGAMSDVIKARYYGTIVVCKRIRRDYITESSLRFFRQEIELMSSLRHPNIVQFIGASWNNCSNLCIIMEYMENGDLHSVLHSNRKKSFTWSDPLLNIALDIVHGMLYLHTREPLIVHRDLKSVNVFCSATFGCKVGDFGLSRRYNKNIDALTTLVGTPFWLAPEIIRSENYGAPADVYSFGIILTELETKKTPYYDYEETGLKLLLRIAHGNVRPTLPALPHPIDGSINDVTAAANRAAEGFPTLQAGEHQRISQHNEISYRGARRKLIVDCLEDDPKKRPEFAELLSRLQNDVQQEIQEEASSSVVKRRAMLRNQRQDHNSHNTGNHQIMSSVSIPTESTNKETCHTNDILEYANVPLNVIDRENVPNAMEIKHKRKTYHDPGHLYLNCTAMEYDVL